MPNCKRWTGWILDGAIYEPAGTISFETEEEEEAEPLYEHEVRVLLQS